MENNKKITNDPILIYNDRKLKEKKSESYSMKVVTAEEMQRIDKITIDEIGLSGEILMGYAGKSIADYIINNINGIKKVAIFSGTGNNGGDGFVIGYHLSNNGFDVDIYIAGSQDRLSDTSRVYLNVCMNSGIDVFEVKSKEDLDIDIERYDLIVDALLGTGFKGMVRGIISEVIEEINRANIAILSVDLPSGLPSDGEAPEGNVIIADYTVTIGLPKISLVTYPGKRYTGKLHVSDIGFPAFLSGSDNLTIDLLDKDYVRNRLNFKRDIDAHKGEIGHLLFIGGFDNMEGAIIMAVKAAFEIGIGLSTLLTTGGARQIIAGRIPELITKTLDCLNSSRLSQVEKYSESSNVIEELSDAIRGELSSFIKDDRRYDAMLIGPGMGRTLISSLLFNIVIDELVNFGISRILIDGDGLYHLSEYLKKNKKLPVGVSFVITPHFYEASRLMEKSVNEIKDYRIRAAMELSQRISAVTVLKGPSTIVSDGTNTLINTTGNPSLATAGSGDILSGVIGALLLKDISTLDVAGIGAYIHGMAADICLKENVAPVLKATDIIKYIRKAILEVIVQKELKFI